MQIRPFTSEDYPALVAIHASLGIVWPEQPRTPRALMEADRNRSTQSRYMRVVAVVDGTAAGYATLSQSPWHYPPRSVYINIEVRPEFQRRGIGAQLYYRILEEASIFNPPALRADAFTNLPQGFAFLQRRGFYEAFRETPVHMELASFDPHPYADIELNLTNQGIEIKTLSELSSDPDRDQKVYELYHEVEASVPQEGKPAPRPAFEDWVGWGLHDSSILQDAYLIAVHGNDYIGLRELGSYSDTDVLMGGLLGVLQGYRRRGIALAMQLRNIAYGCVHGYRLLKDCTAIQNAPMQALFNQLGYVRDPEWQQCQMDF